MHCRVVVVVVVAVTVGATVIIIVVIGATFHVTCVGRGARRSHACTREIDDWRIISANPVSFVRRRRQGDVQLVGQYATL